MIDVKNNITNFKVNKILRKKAFTLAEVLITLGIIGVVAAMTLPVLTGKYQKQIKISQLKNIYSPMQRLDTRVKAEYGDTLNTYLPDSKEFFGQYLIPYLKPVNFCL